MTKVHCLNELATIAKMVAANDDGEVVMADLSKEIVDFLHAIGGKNRDLSAANLADLYNVIESGLWDENESRIVVNSSLSWMPCGHHRIEVLSIIKRFDLKSQILILPDKHAENVYLHEDVVVKRRSSDIQAKEFFGVSIAKDCRTCISFIKENTGRPGAVVLPSEISDYCDRYESLLCQHHFKSHMPTFGGQTNRKRYVPRALYAIAIHLHENGNQFESEAWRLIDELHNVNTDMLAAKMLRESILVHGQGSKTNAPQIFMKAVVVGLDNIKSPTQLYVRMFENTDKYRNALGLTNKENKTDAIFGSRNYFIKELRRSAANQNK